MQKIADNLLSECKELRRRRLLHLRNDMSNSDRLVCFVRSTGLYGNMEGAYLNNGSIVDYVEYPPYLSHDYNNFTEFTYVASFSARKQRRTYF